MARKAKTKTYRLVKFAPEVFKSAYSVFCECLERKHKSSDWDGWTVYYEDEHWGFDNQEEFYSEYRKEIRSAFLHHSHGPFEFEFNYSKHWTEISVFLPSRKDIEKVFGVFEENYEKYKIPEEEVKAAIQERIKVFVGHGRSQQWHDLKDHLQDKHGFKVIAYETGARAGYTIAEVLKGMSEEATIAFLVGTGEDLGKNGILRARENVIHETGLFQGKLGFKRSIVLIEEGCNEFSNIVGIQQLRFSKKNIKEIFGDVLAIIYREFGESNENGS